ncbi:HAD-IIIC family phosphatase [Tahibacter sp.]|uniref:HAD-IIIC family phosphatase n=1 Tax=Tahibacter sp. TaxID=2056211 RepID=UPI0028C4F27B|nr:HAD-IIIC family phosphatase [Tahibacter sp.]
MRKLAKQGRQYGAPLKIALLADSATQFLAEALRGHAATRCMGIDLYEAGIGQIESQIFNGQSDLYRHLPDYLLVLRSSNGLHEEFSASGCIPETFAEAYVQGLKDQINAIRALRPACKIIYFNFPELNDYVYGNYGNSVARSFIYQLRKINLALMEMAQRTESLFICDLSSLQNRFGSAFVHDAKWYARARIAYSLNFLPVVAKHVFDIIAAASGSVKKCIVLDLDNTLWGGVLDEDGIENIQIGELGAGKAFSSLQRWLKHLRQRGILLAVCSRNDEAIAREPFLTHPDMILKLDDIAVFVANWDNKVDNIRHIREILNISFDSMVFLDDNPFERRMVAQAIAEITVPELPSDPALYLDYLQQWNIFEVAAASAADEERTLQYQQEAARRKVRALYRNEYDYLSSINMRSALRPFTEQDLPRVAQLSQRSNQFNVRSSRYTTADVEIIAGSADYFTLSFELSDNYGNHGLVVALVLKREADETLFIEAWMMSCRILNRGMEHFVLNEVANLAQRQGYRVIKGEYLPTRKNALVKDLYARLGFVEQNSYWYLPSQDYVMKPTAILRN